MPSTFKLPNLRASQVDVTLLLEGTYPFISGGVSSWVHQLLQAFPELRFGLVFIGGHPDHYGELKYQLPSHVVHLEAHFVHQEHSRPPVHGIPGDTTFFNLIEQFHDHVRRRLPWEDSEPLLSRLMNELLENPQWLQSQFLFSEAAWDFLAQGYRRYCTDPSFVDYFWTIRDIHAPIWLLGQVASRMIPSKIFHTISTGYAGFLGALLHHKTGNPLILSEHGIYTKERKIDLFQMNWLPDNRLGFEKGSQQIGHFQNLWIRFFETLGRMCYQAADPIISLYEVNRQRQIVDGADPARTVVIPNGIPVQRFHPLRDRRPFHPPPVLGLIGRVVPIKDIKTFIRAMRTIVNHRPEAEGWIVGPQDEDPEYAKECENLVESLGLGQSVKFLGFQKMDEVLPRIGLLVLSSISEALPLVILEAYASGVPVVTTDVGACRQLVLGEGMPEDTCGAAGGVVGMANAEELAHVSLSLLGDERRWLLAQQAGMKRVETFYTQTEMFERYRTIYTKALHHGRDRVRAS